MKPIIILVFMTICSLSFAQNNLLDISTWTVGTGPIGGFELYGPDADNERILGTNPHGNNSVLWVSKPEGATTNTADGGYISPHISIDPTKTYRLTVWIKKTGSNSGVPHFGLYAKNASYSGSTANLDGTHYGNPYFWGGDTPQLDKWYLLVAFVHPNSYSGPDLAAMYEGGTGTLITSANIDDVKFETSSTYLLNRSLLFASREATDRMYHWNPTIYEVNGQEPTVQQLLNPNGGSGSGQNIALGKTATQSSLYGDANEGQASNAVDGNTDGIRVNQSTTHTLNEPVMWWRLDLGAQYDINQIKVYNRTDCCTSRITSAQVYIGNTDSTDSNDYTAVGGALSDLPLNDISGLSTSGRYVMVRLATSSINVSLSLAEIEVYGSLSNGGSNGGSTVWNTSGNNINYTAGKIGVGTATVPNDYLFAVKGKIISEEIKIQLHSQWPDYVFSGDYSLPTLEEIEKHINEKGHLINIPSAKEVEANGIELGEMNKLLLEKIEELTLYTIEQQKTIEYLVNEINMLKNKK